MSNHQAALSSLDLNTEDLSALWEGAYRSEFGVAPVPLKKKELYALRTVARSWQRENRTPFGPVFEWCLLNWALILVTRFRNMTSRPDLPEPFFFVKFSSTFLAAFRQREQIEAESNLPKRERDIRRTMRVKGMSREAAEQTLNEGDAATSEAHTLNQARKKLERATRSHGIQKLLTEGAGERIEKFRSQKKLQTVAKGPPPGEFTAPTTFGTFGGGSES